MGGRERVFALCPAVVARRATRDDEVADLLTLLVEHADAAAGTPPEIERVALTIAVASLGEKVLICKSPSCAVCTDHETSFGPEA